ncbi:hypothetical protein ACQEUX_24075 [Micromonospora sp. CA-259024]|uniref:hypothetical protein n=1 Tax=Micromonospora sp. CA-259024 TaxID=3239965 RepID=UPI003D8DBD92
MAELEELVLTIARHLELDWQYVERVEAWNTERIADVRSAGRRAGGRIGYKIATFQSDADDEGRVVVIVAVREPPNAEDHRRMTDRGMLLMNDFWSKLLPGDDREP